MADIARRRRAFDFDLIEVFDRVFRIALVARPGIAAGVGKGLAPGVMDIERQPVGEPLLQ